jgi:hypothetical protein
VVGVLGSPEGLEAIAELDQTGTHALTADVCGGELDQTRFACTFALYPGARDTSARITLAHSSGDWSSAISVALAPHNYCGREVAYVEFTPAPEGGSWSEPRFINPGSLPP